MLEHGNRWNVVRNVDPTEVAAMGRIVEWIYENEIARLEQAMDEAMAAIRDTDYGRAHRVLYEARNHA